MVTVLRALDIGETESWLGEKLQVAPAGRPVQARVTVPLKLFVGATLTTIWLEDPAAIVGTELDALTPKVGAPVGVGLLEMTPKSP